jgi:hypothetical protein
VKEPRRHHCAVARGWVRGTPDASLTAWQQSGQRRRTAFCLSKGAPIARETADARRRQDRNQTATVSLLTRVPLRVLIEFTFTDGRAEIVRLALVFTLARRLVLVDLHLAHGVGDHRFSSIGTALHARLIGSCGV